ncbi:hypothetical protein BZA05DRAFT_471738 [Tricharina praecox]|uniref:uncharacterized protein n=1 Tax=Tricharina praecox TaxID=43433 RepID=UPI00221E78F6|nr:uncharacterized protein BZA05DRAFT_471738 [Tricharina praecox]KAI5855727.1 hypothetical protein BZA05DRAFT_471738 [Tricharina praecox]
MSANIHKRRFSLISSDEATIAPSNKTLKRGAGSVKRHFFNHKNKYAPFVSEFEGLESQGLGLISIRFPIAM